MNIEGPINIGVVDDPAQPGRELHLAFRPEFQQLERDARVAEFETYIKDLGARIATEPEHSPDRQGMLVVQQIAEHLLPHLRADDIPLEETIIIEIRPEMSLGSLLHTPFTQ